MAMTRSQTNKRIRQDALREQLASQGHVQHVIDLIDDLKEPAPEFSALDLQRVKLIIDTKLALIKKYLPDPKQVELTGEDGDAIKTDGKFTIEIVRPS